MPGHPRASSLEPISAKTSAHIQENPEMHQIRPVNQANQNDPPKETRKKCPNLVSQTARRLRLSDSLSLSRLECLSTRKGWDTCHRPLV